MRCGGCQSSFQRLVFSFIFRTLPISIIIVLFPRYLRWRPDILPPREAEINPRAPGSAEMPPTRLRRHPLVPSRLIPIARNNLRLKLTVFRSFPSISRGELAETRPPLHNGRMHYAAGLKGDGCILTKLVRASAAIASLAVSLVNFRLELLKAMARAGYKVTASAPDSDPVVAAALQDNRGRLHPCADGTDADQPCRGFPERCGRCGGISYGHDPMPSWPTR